MENLKAQHPERFDTLAVCARRAARFREWTVTMTAY
jgi:hypothetical protein